MGHAGEPEQLPGGHLLLIHIFLLPLNRVSQKNALSKLPFFETEFEGMADLRFVKKFTRPDFRAKKFYTLKETA